MERVEPVHGLDRCRPLGEGSAGGIHGGPKPTIRLRDPDGKLVRETLLTSRSTLSHRWTEWTVDVPPVGRGKLWGLQVRPIHAKVSEVWLRVDGVPPVIADSPASHFIPDRIPEVVRSTPKPRPEGVTAPVRIIPAGKEFTVPRGNKVGDRLYEHVNLDEGTIKFWMRADWDAAEMTRYNSSPSFTPHQDIVRLGQLFARRCYFGWRGQMGKGVLPSHVVPSLGDWHHVALTWDLDAMHRNDLFCMFVNGKPQGTLWNSPPEPGEDWTADTFRIRATSGPVHIAALRISKVSRHKEIAKGEFCPLADANTLYFDRGD